MTACRDEHWLDAVARVLRAETGDLRELAAIGGADPRTLFIGTSLNGVDIRGQDLRGMSFTDLDLLKVRHDDATQVDDPPALDPQASEFADIEALLYFSDGKLLDDYRRDLHRHFPTARLYDRRGKRQFAGASGRFSGPKIVVVGSPWEADLRALAPLLDATDVLVLVHRNAPNARPTDDELHDISDLDLPVIFSAPMSDRRPRARGAPTLLGAPFRTALKVAVENWASTFAAAKRLRRSLLLAAKGLGPNTTTDAWAQIFGRSVALHLTGAPSIAQVTDGADQAQVARTLFPQLQYASVLSDGSAASFDVVLLTQLDVGPLPGEDRHENLIAALLRSLRWNIHSSTEGQQTGIDFIIRGADRSLPVRAKRMRQLRLPLDLGDRRHPIEAIHKIVISETANASMILDRLLDREELWVSTRDILGFRTDTPELWLLLAAQLRRIRATASTEDLTTYLAMLLRAALEEERLPSELTARLANLLDEDGPDHGHRLSISRMQAGREHLDCTIRLDFSYVTPVESFRLRIDRHGPHLIGVSRGYPQLGARAR